MNSIFQRANPAIDKLFDEAGSPIFFLDRLINFLAMYGHFVRRFDP